MDYWQIWAGQKATWEFYDTIDFRKFMDGLDHCYMSVDEILERASIYYDIHHPDLMPEELDGIFTNFITTEEFAKYLGKRYGLGVCQDEIVKYYLVGM